MTLNVTQLMFSTLFWSSHISTFETAPIYIWCVHKLNASCRYLRVTPSNAKTYVSHGSNGTIIEIWIASLAVWISISMKSTQFSHLNSFIINHTLNVRYCVLCIHISIDMYLNTNTNTNCTHNKINFAEFQMMRWCILKVFTKLNHSRVSL